MYSRTSSKKTRTQIRGFDMDLRESTDFAERERGTVHLKALMKYSAFPYWYGFIMCTAFLETMEVTEEITIDEGFDVTREPYHGYITEAAMMGPEPTKIVLHLAHIRAA